MDRPLDPCAACGHRAPHTPTLGCLHNDYNARGLSSGDCDCAAYLPPTPVVVSSTTLERARAERDAAMAQVAEHTDPEWLGWAEAAVGTLAEQGDPFTTDDVWTHLEALGVPAPREPRALGPVMKRAVKAGTIEWTGGYTASTRRHTAPVRVYVRNHR